MSPSSLSHWSLYTTHLESLSHWMKIFSWCHLLLNTMSSSRERTRGYVLLWRNTWHIVGIVKQEKNSEIHSEGQVVQRNNEITPFRRHTQRGGQWKPRGLWCQIQDHTAWESWTPSWAPGLRTRPCCPQSIASLWRWFCLAISPWAWLSGQGDGTIPEARCVV